MRHRRKLLLYTLQYIVQVYHIVPRHTRRLEERVNEPVAVENGAGRVVGCTCRECKGDAFYAGFEIEWGRTSCAVASSPVFGAKRCGSKLGSGTCAATAERNESLSNSNTHECDKLEKHDPK